MALLFALCLFGWISLATPASLTFPTTSTSSTTASSVAASHSATASMTAKLVAQSPPSSALLLPPTQQQPSNALLTAIRTGPLEKSDAIFQVANALFQKERKWLQSEKWLIDNVYRLRNELGSLKRELADMRNSAHPSNPVAHLQQPLLSSSLSQLPMPLALRATTRQPPTGESGENYRVEFVHDIGSLRADHNVLAQQQQQLMQLLKDTQSQLMRSNLEQRQQLQQQLSLQQHLLSPTVNNLLAYEQVSKPSAQANQHTSSATSDEDQKSKPKQKRALKEILPNEETVAELAAELHSIRQASTTLFKDLQTLQKRVLSESVARTSSVAAQLAPR